MVRKEEKASGEANLNANITPSFEEDFCEIIQIALLVDFVEFIGVFDRDFGSNQYGISREFRIIRCLG